MVHQEAMRPVRKHMPRRCSRHYYDLHRPENSPSSNRRSTILSPSVRVVEFKEMSCRAPWAQLSEARLETLRLVSLKFRIGGLEVDFRSIVSMLFVERPKFGEIVRCLIGFEESVDALSE